MWYVFPTEICLGSLNIPGILVLPMDYEAKVDLQDAEGPPPLATIATEETTAVEVLGVINDIELCLGRSSC